MQCKFLFLQTLLFHILYKTIFDLKLEAFELMYKTILSFVMKDSYSDPTEKGTVHR